MYQSSLLADRLTKPLPELVSEHRVAADSSHRHVRKMLKQDIPFDSRKSYGVVIHYISEHGANIIKISASPDQLLNDALCLFCLRRLPGFCGRIGALDTGRRCLQPFSGLPRQRAGS
ncbi:hypothetical protein ALO62_102507 [Pseudomonas amygdali pv. myricae]|nr:hypothetical protein ALO62_102507 [Pseudomonas amygdali pv. myricae]